MRNMSPGVARTVAGRFDHRGDFEYNTLYLHHNAAQCTPPLPRLRGLPRLRAPRVLASATPPRVAKAKTELGTADPFANQHLTHSCA